MEGESKGDKYFNFAFADSRIGSGGKRSSRCNCKDLRENPTYDSCARYIPIWGSARQAYLDFSVGKYRSGSFNAVMSISDVFLLKSIAYGAWKGGFTALGKNYSYWGSWRSFYGKEGYAVAKQQLHSLVYSSGWTNKRER
ncbi:MAG: hypothetical protein IPL67_10450 [Ignavibacteria bacterium]|nr:hypothetical protein [Ignavibacteria bacterium]